MLDVQILQDSDEIQALKQCSSALRQLKKDVELAEIWMGFEDVKQLEQTRSVLDRMNALTELCVQKENINIDIGME